MTASQIIIDSWNLCKKNAKAFVPYIGALLGVSILTLITDILIGPVDTFDQLIKGLPFVILAALFSLVGLWISLGMITAVASIKKTGSAKPIRTVLTYNAKFLWPVILASILTGLAIGGGFLLLVVPAIIFSVWLTFTTHAILLDNKKVVESLKYSKSLVDGRWWEVLWLILAPTLAFVAPMILIDKLGIWLIKVITELSIAAAAIGAAVWSINIVTALLILLISPLSSAALTLLYLHLQERK